MYLKWIQYWTVEIQYIFFLKISNDLAFVLEEKSKLERADYPLLDIISQDFYNATEGFDKYCYWLMGENAVLF